MKKLHLLILICCFQLTAEAQQKCSFGLSGAVGTFWGNSKPDRNENPLFKRETITKLSYKLSAGFYGRFQPSKRFALVLDNQVQFADYQFQLEDRSFDDTYALFASSSNRFSIKSRHISSLATLHFMPKILDKLSIFVGGGLQVLLSHRSYWDDAEIYYQPYEKGSIIDNLTPIYTFGASYQIWEYTRFNISVSSTTQSQFPLYSEDIYFRCFCPTPPPYFRALGRAKDPRYSISLGFQHTLFD